MSTSWHLDTEAEPSDPQPFSGHKCSTIHRLYPYAAALFTRPVIIIPCTLLNVPITVAALSSSSFRHTILIVTPTTGNNFFAVFALFARAAERSRQGRRSCASRHVLPDNTCSDGTTGRDLRSSALGQSCADRPRYFEDSPFGDQYIVRRTPCLVLPRPPFSYLSRGPAPAIFPRKSTFATEARSCRWG